MSILPPQLPDNAPFSGAQRAWLNGYLAGLASLNVNEIAVAAEVQVNEVAAATAEDEDFPWHDPAIELDERMELAEGRALNRRMMAAMGQLDCGQCGYDCQTYAEAIVSGAEAKLNRCQPGGKATQRMLKKLMAEGDAPGGDAVAAPHPAAEVRPASVVATFAAAVPLHPEKAEKDTRHVVIDLKGTGLDYVPGDSLGVMPANDPVLVDKIIAALSADPAFEVGDGNGHSRTLQAALLEDVDLRTPTEATFKLLADVAADKDEAVKLCLMAEDEDPDGDLDELDLLDVLEKFPSARPDAKALVETLDELQPRLYSISSSPRTHPDEVHLTVGVTRETKRDRLRNGVASTFFAERIEAGTPIKVYRQPAHGFALPDDDEKPVIMIGPGTGIAPFRAFLEERSARKAKGPNWLFFGNPHGGTDYLYRDELEGFAQSGLLTRLDTAFSRDQTEKIYVQHRILEHGQDIWRWLEDGAHVYVCGDAKRMAADVDQALQDVATRHGVDGKAFVTGLTKSGRYQRDVY
ncbi:MAG: sulfite reductase subunit alpha [Pseudomonadota bacterium]